MSVRAKKHLGQHFLTDQTVAQNIANLVKDTSSDIILEIGPGTGVLTQYLNHFGSKLHLVEIDHRIGRLFESTLFRSQRSNY